MFRTIGFRQIYCVYSTSERYSLRGHQKVRRLFLQCREHHHLCSGTESSADIQDTESIITSVRVQKALLIFKTQRASSPLFGYIKLCQYSMSSPLFGYKKLCRYSCKQCRGVTSIFPATRDSAFNVLGDLANTCHCRFKI